MSGGDTHELPESVLRRAFQLALDVALAHHVARPARPYPATLRRLIYLRRPLKHRELAIVRRALEGDAAFRAAVAARASVELVGPAGMTYLRAAADPDTAVDPGTIGDAAVAGDLAGELVRQRRRRAAAEAAADAARRAHVDEQTRHARTAAELDDIRRAAHDAHRDHVAELDALRDQVAALDDAVAALRERVALQERMLAERDERIATLDARGASLDAALAQACSARDAALAARAEWHRRHDPPVAEPGSVRGSGDTSADGPGDHDGAWRDGVREIGRPRTRQPIGLPGGVRADTAEAAEHLMRTAGVHVIVDGYNVGKLSWPAETLEAQRTLTIGCLETIAARWGTDVRVVFDGTDVVGASTTSRRGVLVEYSPAGVIADQVIVERVRALAADTPVVVITNDREIVDAVRRLGANPLASDALVAVALR